MFGRFFEKHRPARVVGLERLVGVKLRTAAAIETKTPFREYARESLKSMITGFRKRIFRAPKPMKIPQQVQSTPSPEIDPSLRSDAEAAVHRLDTEWEALKKRGRVGVEANLVWKGIYQKRWGENPNNLLKLILHENITPQTSDVERILALMEVVSEKMNFKRLSANVISLFGEEQSSNLPS